MRKIEILEVGMENFGPYIDPMILTFEKNTLTLMTGPNGSGKTTALDAIPFTLYNDTTKGGKGDDLVNNVSGKNCKTWVKFIVNDIDEYIITRYQKYTRFGNTVILNKNGENIKRGSREVLPVIEKLICSKRAFMNTLMFGQKVKDFFTDLLDSDKKLIFRELLFLILYDNYYKTTNDSLKENKLNQANIENSINITTGLLEDTFFQIKIITKLKQEFKKNKKTEISDLEDSITVLKEFLKECKNKSKKLSSKNIDVDIDITINKIDNSLTQLYKEESQEKDKVKQQQAQKTAEIQVKASNAKTEILKKFKIDYDIIQLDITKYQKKMTDLNTLQKDKGHKSQTQISQINSEIGLWQKQIKEIEVNVLDENISQCPTCKQKIGASIIELLNKKILGYQTQITEAQQDINNIQQIYDKVHLKYTENLILIQETIVKFQEKQNSSQDNIDKETWSVTDRGNITIKAVNQLAIKLLTECLETFVNRKETLINEKSKLLIIKEKQNIILEEINKAEIIITDIDGKIQQKTYQLKEKNKDDFDETQLNTYQLKEKEFNQKIKDDNLILENIKASQKLLEFWKAGFSSTGIPSMLIDEAIPFMNERVKYYLDKFTNGRYIVSFDTLAETKSGEFRDKISVNVLDTLSRANNRVQLSGGQTRIIDIATILTLGDLQASIQGVSINILLFDEIFDSLDEENIGHVSRVLNQIKKDKSIYLISHVLIDALEADQVLNFHK